MTCLKRNLIRTIFLLITVYSFAAGASERGATVYKVALSRISGVIEVGEEFELANDYSYVVIKGMELECSRQVEGIYLDFLRLDRPDIVEVLNCSKDNYTLTVLEEGRKLNFHGMALLIRQDQIN